MVDTDISRNGQLLVTAENTGDHRIYKSQAAGPGNQWSQVAHTILAGGGLDVRS
jgi:hypothetical protein